jgi:hypothetical protein
MKTAAVRISVLIFASMTLAGCAIGYNSMLFITKSNVGIDVDTKPPTAEVSIARREGVIAPTFEKGQTPPVMASFRVHTKGLIGLFANVSSTFAGGDAAKTMSKLFGDADATEGEDSTLCLKQKPAPKVMGIKISFPGQGKVEPFIFGTDTALGLKVAWSGLTAQYPDTVKFGYNRKEFAFAPVLGSKEASETVCGKTGGKYSVKVPSFVATVDSYVDVKDPAGTSIGWLQYFATGTAATNLTLRKDVRKVMLERLDPAAAEQLKKFEDYSSNQKAQMESIKNIQAAYDKAVGSGRDKIREKAAQLGLVPAGTPDAEFKGKLSESLKPQDSGVTKKLKELEDSVK